MWEFRFTAICGWKPPGSRFPLLALSMFGWARSSMWTIAACHGHPRYLRHRKAVDVEGPATHRLARNQRAARSRRSHVKLILASEDVIHDFSVPAFRVKMDVVPPLQHHVVPSHQGWTLPLFFASSIAVQITQSWAMGYRNEPMEYAAWLSGSSDATANPVVAGEKLFAEKACTTCHLSNGPGARLP